MHDESNKQPCCNPPWEPPQVIPAQVRRVNNLKRLILTEEGGRVHEKTMLSLHQTDEFVAGLLTEEENAELLRLLNKLRKGLE